MNGRFDLCQSTDFCMVRFGYAFGGRSFASFGERSPLNDRENDSTEDSFLDSYEQMLVPLIVSTPPSEDEVSPPSANEVRSMITE